MPNSRVGRRSGTVDISAYFETLARNVEKITGLYTNVFGLTVTDQGGNPADL